MGIPGRFWRRVKQEPIWLVCAGFLLLAAGQLVGACT